VLPEAKMHNSSKISRVASTPYLYQAKSFNGKGQPHQFHRNNESSLSTDLLEFDKNNQNNKTNKFNNPKSTKK